MPHESTPPRSADAVSRALARVLRDETVRLALLVLVALATTLATAAIANASRALQQRDGADWFDRGRARLARGEVEAAIEALRRATLTRRGDVAYLLPLADALTRSGRTAAATRALLAARDTHPDNPDVNLALARLAAGRGEPDTAVRYYQNALYGIWPSADGPRAVRLELVRLLLAEGQRQRAVAELMAAASDAPDTAADLEIGQLFARAGEYRHALERFTAVLAASPGSGAALEGAGRAAFALADYPQARRLLAAAPPAPEVTMMQAIADFVVTRDPLAARIGSAERRRRATDNVRHAAAHLRECVGSRPPSAHEAALAGELGARPFSGRLRADAETLEAAVDLVFRVERHVQEACGPAAPLDDALVRIARRHGGDQP